VRKETSGARRYAQGRKCKINQPADQGLLKEVRQIGEWTYFEKRKEKKGNESEKKKHGKK